MSTNGSDSDHSSPAAARFRSAGMASTNGHNGKAALPLHSEHATEEKNAFEATFLWSVLRKWSRVSVVGGMLLAGIVAALVWYLHVPVYRASFLLKITEQQKGILTTRIDQNEFFVQNQRVLLRSAILLNRLLQHEDIAKLPDLVGEPDPEAWLRKRLEVKQEAGSNVFNVTFESPSPIQATTVLNALIGEYFNYYMSDARLSSKQLIEVLKKRLAYELDEVKQQQDKVDDLNRKSTPAGSLVPDLYGFSLGGFNPQTQALFQQLVSKEVERTSAAVHLTMEEEAAKKPFEMAPDEVQAEIAANLFVRKAEFDLRLLRDALTKFTQGTTPYKDHETLIGKASEELKNYRASLKEQIPKVKREQVAGERAIKIEGLRRTLQTLDAEIMNLRQRVSADIKESERVSGARSALVLAKSELDRAKEKLSKIGYEKWLLEVELDEGHPVPVLKLQQKADVPKVPVEAIPYKKMGALSAFGLFVPFGLCVLGEFFARRLFSSRQMSDELKLPLLGEVSTVPRRPRIPRPGGARRYQRDRSAYEESVDSLRVALAVCSGIDDAKVLVVTSSVSGEGKSTLAVRLAFSWARGAGEKVLVVDADLRSPDLHKFFEIDASPGLGEILLGTKQPEEAIKDWGHGLNVLPAGNVSMSPHRLFSNGGLHQFLETARKSYDRIVIDVPPILVAGEALQVAKEADGVLFCARKDVSRAPQMKMACQRLELSGAHILGCVFIGAENRYYSQ